MALQYSTQTTPYANSTAHFNFNSTDPCMRHTNAILPPLEYSGTAYVAIGPISDFSSTFQSCCPNKSSNAIQNYHGGSNRSDDDAPLSCYYYYSFNSTYREVDAALNCTKQKAEENGDLYRLILAASPDWPGESGGTRTGARVGAWKWAVLGLVLVGAAGV
ncbi:hypothetical protein E8E12_002107 [Didymella heteroderae]|uniref:Uncharacterized protein n=1 Tax=Didymella heteroderae TaxID=1769908 RepID=A0A9P4WGQ4_9PLEO|nr:hypothetical protein E8E12_002107 [Didymella heteroderae]